MITNVARIDPPSRSRKSTDSHWPIRLPDGRTPAERKAQEQEKRDIENHAP